MELSTKKTSLQNMAQEVRGMNEENNSFVGYEYRNVTIKEPLENMYVDGYMNFGWQLESSSQASHGKREIILNLKRDRKIKNKAELAKFQRQFEAYMEEINSLESKKVVGAATVAYAVGVIGTAFMAGSVFAYIGGLLVPSIILAVPGFLGWITPYLLFSNIRSKKTEQIEPLINQKHDEIYGVCEKANALL